MSVLQVPAYIAIGSNLDEPETQVRSAFEALAALPHCRLMARSRLYRTAPLGPADQPDFVNAAAGLLTTLSSQALLAELKQLERLLGRAQPVQRWGPRRIDFDLSVYGSEQRDDPDLVLPHPGVHVRNFVLYPLLDIAPDLLVPGHGRIKDLAARVGASGLHVIA